jgi:nucleotide-binding universal stress UspA family protein
MSAFGAGRTLIDMAKPILVAIDDSPRAQIVLGSAVKLALTFRLPLVLCRVIMLPTAQFTTDGLPTGIDLQPELEALARKDLEAMARSVPPDVETRLTTTLDVPWEGICEMAQKEDASLIVIGSHSYSRLDLLLGTTAAKVVNHADRSVLVVRDGWPE